MEQSLPYKYLGISVSRLPRLSIQIGGVAITQLVIYALVFYFCKRVPQSNALDSLFTRKDSFWTMSKLADLLSNLPLFLVAFSGMALTSTHMNAFHSKVEQTIWINMFLFIGMLAISSAACIISPDNFNLLIERASFMGAYKSAFGLVMYQFLGYELVSITSLPILVEAFASVFYSYFCNDLRWFFAAQIVPVILHVIFNRTMPALYSKAEWLTVSLACFVAARTSQLTDHYIHHYTDGYMTGNALATLLMASQYYCLHAWLSTRSITRQMTKSENMRTR